MGTPSTDADSLSQTASHATIDAYRALGPAVAELNRIAGLRAKLTAVLHYGPFQPPVAAFVTDVPDQMGMQDAWNKWVGESETVQHNMPFAGSHLTDIARPRLGGAWLALVHGGYQLRLNNASETQDVIDHAHKAA